MDAIEAEFQSSIERRLLRLERGENVLELKNQAIALKEETLKLAYQRKEDELASRERAVELKLQEIKLQMEFQQKVHHLTQAQQIANGSQQYINALVGTIDGFNDDVHSVVPSYITQNGINPIEKDKIFLPISSTPERLTNTSKNLDKTDNRLQCNTTVCPSCQDLTEKLSKLKEKEDYLNFKARQLKAISTKVAVGIDRLERGRALLRISQADLVTESIESFEDIVDGNNALRIAYDQIEAEAQNLKTSNDLLFDDNNTLLKQLDKQGRMLKEVKQKLAKQGTELAEVTQKLADKEKDVPAVPVQIAAVDPNNVPAQA